MGEWALLSPYGLEGYVGVDGLEGSAAGLDIPVRPDDGIVLINCTNIFFGVCFLNLPPELSHAPGQQRRNS
jgi:hypothetical protein